MVHKDIGFLHRCKTAVLTDYMYIDDKGQRAEVATMLAKIGTAEANLYLSKMLADPDTGIRLIAAEALAMVSNQDAISVLDTLRYDNDSNIRLRVPTALANCASVRSLEILADIYRSGDYINIRVAAVQAIGRCGMSEATPVLEEILNSNSAQEIKVCAAAELGKLDSSFGKRNAADLLTDSSELAQLWGAIILSCLDDPEGIAALQTMAASNDQYVRCAASDALGQVSSLPLEFVENLIHQRIPGMPGNGCPTSR